MGLRDQSRALVSADARAERMYKSAIAHLGRTIVTRDLAYARLLYGEWLRRENRRVDAREQLRAAYEYFAAMGARGLAGRAEAELLATGERAHPRTPDKLPYLTPQERRVATLAAERLTNPEIAAKLFLSSATVDYHLRKVYRKLNITSRRQLAESLRKMSADPGRGQAVSS
jgi:DNA-binding CsgD family transcriptional regulator